MERFINATRVAPQPQSPPNDEFSRAVAKREQGPLAALSEVISKPRCQAGDTPEPVDPYAVDGGVLRPDAPDRRGVPGPKTSWPWGRPYVSAGAPGKSGTPHAQRLRKAGGPPVARCGFSTQGRPDGVPNCDTGALALPAQPRSELWSQGRSASHFLLRKTCDHPKAGVVTERVTGVPATQIRAQNPTYVRPGKGRSLCRYA